MGTMSSTAMRGDGLRVVEREAMRNAAAAIVSHHREAVEAEMLHQLDLVLRHGALGIVDVLLAICRLAAVAIAAQVGGDDGVFLRQFGRHAEPGQVRQRSAVDQQQGRPAAADHGVQLARRWSSPFRP